MKPISESTNNNVFQIVPIRDSDRGTQTRKITLGMRMRTMINDMRERMINLELTLSKAISEKHELMHELSKTRRQLISLKAAAIIHEKTAVEEARKVGSLKKQLASTYRLSLVNQQ